MLTILLQTTQPEVEVTAETVKQLSQSAIDLAEAASNYGALKVIFGVFMVFIIILICMFAIDNFIQKRKINELHKDMKKVTDYFNAAANHSIGQPEAAVMVRRSINYLSILIKYTVLKIRLENHIDEKDRVKQKISKTLENSWSELHSFYSTFTVNDIQLSNILDHQDLDPLKTLMEEQVYINNFSCPQMEQNIDLYLHGIKLIYLKQLNSTT